MSISLEANSFFQLFSMVSVVRVLLLGALTTVSVALNIVPISALTSIFFLFVVFLLVSLLCPSFLFKGGESVSAFPFAFAPVIVFCFVDILLRLIPRWSLFPVADVKNKNIYWLNARFLVLAIILDTCTRY